ncbi:hypothetical protein D9757_004557 [Collybiopsis confluens]|uniref:DNA 3'-5' helicase n=1 Tax=Collybiopsis confluens TaxID=2823264 RepID=A0A8H5HWK5_9AGAR|nr:hypothetical protein D9757_004557 [Collybiopsis confluens]
MKYSTAFAFAFVTLAISATQVSGAAIPNPPAVYLGPPGSTDSQQGQNEEPSHPHLNAVKKKVQTTKGQIQTHLSTVNRKVKDYLGTGSSSHQEQGGSSQLAAPGDKAGSSRSRASSNHDTADTAARFAQQAKDTAAIASNNANSGSFSGVNLGPSSMGASSFLSNIYSLQNTLDVPLHYCRIFRPRIKTVGWYWALVARAPSSRDVTHLIPLPSLDHWVSNSSISFLDRLCRTMRLDFKDSSTPDNDSVLQEMMRSEAGSATPPIRPSQAPQHDSLESRFRQNDLKTQRTQQTIDQARKVLEQAEEDMNIHRLEREELEQERYAQMNVGSSLVVKGGKNKIDYENGNFQWEGSLAKKRIEVFKIREFRFCQRGVCNANMDGRDIVVVMPTGGGKSLTYQLPAILSSGVTLVISPLISLITDQIMHLRNANIEAVKMTGSTSKSDQDAIHAKLINMAAGRESEETEIKLLYCTPEKIAKSKRFTSLLQKVRDGGKLVRIVVDEAHCVSQIGHDFRPDYAKLHVLRQLFPEVPIMALSATCPPVVLKDLLKVLLLKPTVRGTAADLTGTVYFTSPLYRPNLHYKVLPKAAEGSKVYAEMTAWILANHKDASGIVYCLSKKDTEKVAEELSKRGGIRTGVYHSDRPDGEKEKLHKDWQKGVVKVVCATIGWYPFRSSPIWAFGLGIDKGDVRFVIHHSISKSLDGFYQESGRAGRDGNDSDCILYYRPQDASTLSAMVLSDKDGATKLHAMLSFVQNIQECRKIQFANYFSHSSNLSITSWSTSGVSATQRCGHCDNCTRPADSFERKDVTVEAWQLLKIMQSVHQNVTLAKVADLARSTGKGTFLVAGSGGDIENVLVDLLLRRYLKEQLFSTAYSNVSYIKLGERAPLLTRFPDKDSLANISSNLRIWCSFRVKLKTLKKAKTLKAGLSPEVLSASASSTLVAVPSTSNLTSNQSRKGKEKAIESVSHAEDEMDGIVDEESDGYGDLSDFAELVARATALSPKLSSSKGVTWRKWRASGSQTIPSMPIDISSDEEDVDKGESLHAEAKRRFEFQEDEIEDSDEEDDNEWETRYLSGPPRKRRKANEVIELSSD